MSDRIIVGHDPLLPDGNVYADQISDVEATPQHEWLKHEAILTLEDEDLVVRVSLCTECGLIVPGHSMTGRRLPLCDGPDHYRLRLIGSE